MLNLLAVAVEIAVVAGVILAYYMLMMTMRLPNGPSWLGSPFVAPALALLLTGGLFASILFLTIGLKNLGVWPGYAWAVAVGFAAAMFVVLWYVLGVGRRLSSGAEAGSTQPAE